MSPVSVVLGFSFSRGCLFVYDSLRVHFEAPRWLTSKESPTSAGAAGSVPGSGRSPGEGNGNPLQCSCQDNPMDREDAGGL